ncbi:site-specific integrase [Streptomyces sp. NPDC002088]|uniref:site-specific integrase n=1 Tax=Streptomyces sp. NPDC002088 TaxID=3154665 RepID=UPI00332B86BB
MVDQTGPERDLASFVLPEIGRLVETGDPWQPYQLLGLDGTVVEPVAAYFADLQAASRPATTIRSYCMDLLRWFRFLWAADVPWNKATRVEGRDFSRWLQIADKPVRVHWRYQRKGLSEDEIPRQRTAKRTSPGTPNPVTGKPTPGTKYAANTRAHSESVLRAFYDFHLDEGAGPLINPFPLDRARRTGRANAHHNPLEPFERQRQGRYRPTVPKRAPRQIPDKMFNALFAALKYTRDRALLAAWVSTGARADELLTSRQHHADPGQQLITVIRKGTQESQDLPASPDTFVWLRLYQEEAWRQGVPGAATRRCGGRYGGHGGR